VSVLGVALVAMSDSAWKLSRTWIRLAMTLCVVGIAVSHGVLFPNARRMLLVVILVLMIWKPGA
jgi:hypothetical protein